MIGIQKTEWKLVCLILISGLLLRTPHAQNTAQISVVEEDEQKLLELLQQTNFGFEVETTIQEKEEDDDDQLATNGISLLKPGIEEPTEKNSSTKTIIPEKILEFADFVDQYDPPERSNVNVVSFEIQIADLLTQSVCQKDSQNFGRIGFNAVGKIKISLLNGGIKYCTGTLIGDNAVITSAECYPLKNATGQNVRSYYQPSWDDTEWYTIKAVYIPDQWVENGLNNNIAIFFLQNPLYAAPKIDFDIGQIQTQQCYITLLGWKNTILNNGYKMVTCPNLPDVEDKLGIESKNCGEISCNLDDMDFETGSPIILTCPIPSIKHTVIGVLYMREDNLTKSENIADILIGANFGPKKFAFPYMFNQQDFLDIAERVKTGIP